MGLAVETPAREDLSFRTNDDQIVGARWLASDGTTPVPVTAAVLTFEFDLPPIGYDPAPVPELHRIDSTTPGDPAGWVDPAGLATGTVVVTVPHTVWADYATFAGRWDLIATSGGMQHCLVRGRFSVEEGIST